MNFVYMIRIVAIQAKSNHITTFSGAGAESKHGHTLQTSQGKSILEFLHI